MAEHARVVWAPAPEPWNTEEHLIRRVFLPLNLNQNRCLPPNHRVPVHCTAAFVLCHLRMRQDQEFGLPALPAVPSVIAVRTSLGHRQQKLTPVPPARVMANPLNYR